MIIRIVKMTFKEESIQDFLALFETIKDKILSSDGCSHLELLKDEKEDNIYFTYSHWATLDHLDDYRNSELFDEIWPKVKAMFSAQPQAHSLYNVDKVE